MAPSETNSIELEEFLHSRIPLTRAMGVRVVLRPGGDLSVEAPVALNYNHLQTAFGGSINAVATLAAYGFLWLEVRGSPVEVVVAESRIRFLRPVREQISAVCSAPGAEELKRFHDDLATKGKSRIQLTVTVEENGRTAAEFSGEFVALRSPA